MASNTAPSCASYDFSRKADCWECPLVSDPTDDNFDYTVSAYAHHVHCLPPSSVQEFLQHMLYAPAIDRTLIYMDMNSRTCPYNTLSSAQESVQRVALDYSCHARTASAKDQQRMFAALKLSVNHLLRGEYRDKHPGLGPYSIPMEVDTVIDAKAEEFAGLFTRLILEAPRSWGEALETWFCSGK